MEQLITGPDGKMNQTAPRSSSPSKTLENKSSPVSTENNVTALSSEKINDKSTTDSVLSNSKVKESLEIFYKRKLKYLIKCYERVGNEERLHFKVRHVVSSYFLKFILIRFLPYFV